jgi:hypothetical protein
MVVCVMVKVLVWWLLWWVMVEGKLGFMVSGWIFWCE